MWENAESMSKYGEMLSRAEDLLMSPARMLRKMQMTLLSEEECFTFMYFIFKFDFSLWFRIFQNMVYSTFNR